MTTGWAHEDAVLLRECGAAISTNEHSPIPNTSAPSHRNVYTSFSENGNSPLCCFLHPLANYCFTFFCCSRNGDWISWGTCSCLHSTQSEQSWQTVCSPPYCIHKRNSRSVLHSSLLNKHSQEKCQHQFAAHLQQANKSVRLKGVTLTIVKCFQVLVLFKVLHVGHSEWTLISEQYILSLLSVLMLLWSVLHYPW